MKLAPLYLSLLALSCAGTNAEPGPGGATETDDTQTSEGPNSTSNDGAPTTPSDLDAGPHQDPGPSADPSESLSPSQQLELSALKVKLEQARALSGEELLNKRALDHTTLSYDP